MKTYLVHCEKARFRNAIGSFDLIFRSYFAEDPAGAEKQYHEDLETNGPPLITKEIKSPFDAAELENFSNNSETSAMRIRGLVTSLRKAVDFAALYVARAGKDWHDDKESEDHPLFQASEELKFPRAIRDQAIMELVKTHLQVITDNENAEARRFEKEQNAKD